VSDMRMTLAALSERAAAENRKCCAMMTHPERTSSASFLAQMARLYNPLFSLQDFIGGGCYMMPQNSLW